MGEIIVSTELGSAQSTALERQLSLQLGGLDSKIRTLHASINQSDKQLDMRDANGTVRRTGQQFQCTLEVELISGARLAIVMVNTDPKVCIVDAAARLRRDISRKIRRLELSERAVPALGM